MRSNTGIANRQEDVDLRESQVSAPQIALLAWLGFFGEPIRWVDTTHYLGVTLDTRLTWSPHVNQVRKSAVQRMGTLGPLLNMKSDLSVRNEVLLYKQLIRPKMEYACPT